MAEKKQSRGRRAYLSDFHQSVSGEYIYTGAVYTSAVPDGRTRGSILAELWLWGVVMLASAAAQGCIPAGGMLNCVYVLLPFAGEFLSAVSVIWALVRFSANREPLREYVYSATAEAIPRRAVVTAVFAAATLVGETVFMLLHPAECTGKAWWLPVLMAVTGAAALLLRRRMRTLHWEKHDAGKNEIL